MKRKIFSVLSILMLLFALSACTAQTTTTTGLAADAVLEISSNEIDINLTNVDMHAREQQIFTCKNIDSNGDITEVTGAGFSLGDLLEENGMSLANVASLNFIGSDGYMMAAPAEEFAQTDVFILLDYEGDALQYPRSCIPDKRAMYWVRDLVKIEVVIGDGQELAQNEIVSQVDIFREGVTALEGEELGNRGAYVLSYSLKKYFKKYIGTLPTDPLTMIAKDGFKKTETAEVFFGNYVTLEEQEGQEDELPLYFSETLSNGMRVKQLDLVISGSNAIYFGSNISVPELFETVGMGNAESYSFIASDGFETIVPADAIDFGMIFTDEEKGFIRTSFDGYDWGDTKGGGNIKNLVSIKAKGDVLAAGEAADAIGSETAAQSDSDEMLIKCFIGDQKVIITEADFLSIPQIEKELTKTNSHGETTTGVYEGVHWSEIVKFIDADICSDVVLVASDGYEMTITEDMLNDPDSLFALYEDGENIGSKDGGRVWFCASENFTANNWVKYVTKIVIE